MHARLSTYTMQVEDPARFEAAADAGGAAPSIVEMLLALEGCEGAWAMAEDVPDDASAGRFTETFLSLWQTREQAEVVRDRLGPQIGEVLGGGGAAFAAAPQTQVLLVLAGRTA